MVLLAVWAVSLALANFQSVIGPRRFEPDPNLALATYAIQQTDKEDLLVDLFLEDWLAYVRYLGERNVLELPHLAAYVGRDQAIQALYSTIQSNIQDGHRVFIVDWSGRTDDEWIWPLGIVGLQKSDFDGLEKCLAWTSEGKTIWEVVGTSGQHQ